MKYKTTDITLAATLLCRNFTLSTILVDGKQGTFVFDHVGLTIVSDFYAGNILVDPINFHTNLKRLSAGVKDLTRQNM